MTEFPNPGVASIDECPDAARLHALMPEGYVAWHHWAALWGRAKWRQQRCPTCLLYGLWTAGRSHAVMQVRNGQRVGKIHRATVGTVRGLDVRQTGCGRVINSEPVPSGYAKDLCRRCYPRSLTGFDANDLPTHIINFVADPFGIL